MAIKEKLEELMQKEQYASINMSSKTLLAQSVRQEAVDVISKEISSTRENTTIYSTYKKLNESIQKEFGLNLSDTLAENFNAPKELTDSFIKDARIILVQDIKRQAEYQQIIALPTSMDSYTALLKVSSLLKTQFNLSEEDLSPQRKMKM